MEKIKALFIKLKDKFIKFCKWVWQECKDWHTVVIFAIVVVVMYSPVWGRIFVPRAVRLEMVQCNGNGISCILGRAVYAVFSFVYCCHFGNTADY